MSTLRAFRGIHDRHWHQRYGVDDVPPNIRDLRGTETCRHWGCSHPPCRVLCKRMAAHLRYW